MALSHLGLAKNPMTPKAKRTLLNGMAQNPAHCMVRTPIIGIFSNKITYHQLKVLAEGSLNIKGAGDKGGLRHFSVYDGDEAGVPGKPKKRYTVSQMFKTLKGEFTITDPTFRLTHIYDANGINRTIHMNSHIMNMYPLTAFGPDGVRNPRATIDELLNGHNNFIYCVRFSMELLQARCH